MRGSVGVRCRTKSDRAPEYDTLACTLDQILSIQVIHRVIVPHMRPLRSLSIQILPHTSALPHQHISLQHYLLARKAKMLWWGMCIVSQDMSLISVDLNLLGIYTQYTYTLHSLFYVAQRIIILMHLYLQWVKKLFQCLAILKRVGFEKSGL